MFTLPELPYDYNAFEPHFDEETMRIHHDKHHATYVENLNKTLIGHEDLLAMDINELVKGLDKVPNEIRVKVRNNAGGHANHSLFWTLMLPAQRASSPVGRLKESIDRTFGDFETFQEKFTESALGRFGSGWAWLILDGSDLTIVDTPNQDSPLMEGKTPLLGLDVWEHAYYLKYQNRRAEYIEAWWHVVNWQRAEDLFKDSRKP